MSKFIIHVSPHRYVCTWLLCSHFFLLFFPLETYNEISSFYCQKIHVRPPRAGKESGEIQLGAHGETQEGYASNFVSMMSLLAHMMCRSDTSLTYNRRGCYLPLPISCQNCYNFCQRCMHNFCSL